MTGPGWPSERGWAFIGLYFLSFNVLVMARMPFDKPASQLWETLATAVVITGFLNGAVGHLFTSSKSSADARAQTAEALGIAKTATDQAARAAAPNSGEKK